MHRKFIRIRAATPIIMAAMTACVTIHGSRINTDERIAAETNSTKTVTTETTHGPPTTETTHDEPTTEAEIIIEKEEPEEKEISERELYLLAHLINGEAGASYYSNKHRLYVGSVVLNRVKSEYFPDTIEEVIYQRSQYACTWDGNFDREPSEESWEIAERLLKEGSALPENVVYQAEFEQGEGIYEEIEGSYFCYR